MSELLCVQEVPNQIAVRKNQSKKGSNTLAKDAQKVKEVSEGTLSLLDFSYICSLLLVGNDKSILHHDNMQKQK